MNKKVQLAMVVAVSVLAIDAGTAAAVPREMSFTARLSDNAGPVVGPVNLVFRIYDGAGTMLWEETQSGVSVQDGLLFVRLGSVDTTNNGLDSSVFTGDAASLEVTVDGVVLSPRLSLLSVPYATRAEIAADAEALGGLGADEFARTAHDHTGMYLPVGATLSCGAGDVMTGLDGANGNAVCSPAQTTRYSAAPSGGLALTGNAFSVANSGITAARLARNSVTAAAIANGAVGTTELASSSVTSASIARSAVTTSKIAAGAVTASHIARDAVGATEIATNAVGSSEIATNAVGSSEIATNAVGSSEIAANAVRSSEIAANAVGASEIAASAVDTSELAAGAVTSSRIDSGAVRRSQINGSEVTVYSKNGWCATPGVLVRSGTCSTRSCAPLTYFNCSGICGRAASATCTNAVVGYLLSSSIGL